MSYDEYDAARDQWMDDLYKEHKEEAISEFTTERLHSYFLANPTLAAAPRRALSDAGTLFQGGFYSAAFLFGHIATESGLKAVVLRPVVQGLVHSSSTADFISELALSHVGLDRFRNLLFNILVDHARIDLAHFRRKDAKEPLWKEIVRLQELRNRITHRAEVAAAEEATLSISVAEAVLDEIFPAVIAHLGLHLHEGVRVCNDHLCQLEPLLGTELIERLRSDKA